MANNAVAGGTRAARTATVADDFSEVTVAIRRQVSTNRPAAAAPVGARSLR